MTAFTPTGIMTALVTPFRENHSLDLETLEKLVGFQLDSGVRTVVVTAGAGEYVSLQPVERTEVVRTAAAAVEGKGVLVAGVLAPDTGSALSASVAAAVAGARAVLLLTPYYIAPSIDGLVDHFKVVARAVSLPIIIYNNPARTGVNLELPALQRLTEIPTVVAVKECDRDLGRVARKIDTLGDRLAFLSGDDDLYLPILSIGAPGAIMASTNLIAPWAVELFEATRRGDWARAQELFRTRILRFVNLYRGPDHPGPLKQLMGLAGLPVGTARPPLHPLSDDRLKQASRELQALGLLGTVPKWTVAAGAGASGSTRRARGGAGQA